MAGTAQTDRARRDTSGGLLGARTILPGTASLPQSRPMAPSLGVEVSPSAWRECHEIERAVVAFARSQMGA